MTNKHVKRWGTLSVIREMQMRYHSHLEWLKYKILTITNVDKDVWSNWNSHTLLMGIQSLLKLFLLKLNIDFACGPALLLLGIAQEK